MKHHNFTLSPSDVFSEDNTHWETDEHGKRFLVSDTPLGELAKEYETAEDVILDLLNEYEDDSYDLIEEEKEVRKAREGRY